MSAGDLRTSRLLNKGWSVFKQPYPLSLLLHNARSRQLPAEKTTVESLSSPNSYLPPFPRSSCPSGGFTRRKDPRRRPHLRCRKAPPLYGISRLAERGGFCRLRSGAPRVPPPLKLTHGVLGLGGESSPVQGSPTSSPAWPLGRDEACPRSPNFINIPAWNQVSARAFRQRGKPAARLDQGAPRLPSLLQKDQRVAGGRGFPSLPRDSPNAHIPILAFSFGCNLTSCFPVELSFWQNW